ncbi:hypothetical protein SBRCBS47491_001977 [Sporothrix bragantina]|uniref:Uncharacterized protein n=1 Tax=Sporothrix bragantina TaxID=671064 RepID=A0ABP0B321_9PEZI
MPASSNSSAAYQWRESWPPAQIHLQPTAATGAHSHDASTMIKQEGSHDEMHLADDNPLIYFLTPTPPLLSVDEDGESYFVDDSDSSSYFYDNDNDMDDDDNAFYSSTMDFEFDAGIEDATHPQPIVRSVSPSSLADSIGSGGRISRTAMRPPTPPRASTSMSLHPNRSINSAVDDDGEDYIHFGGANHASRSIPASSPAAKGKSAHFSYSPLSSSPASPRSLPDIHDLYALHHSNNSTSHLTAAGATIVRRRSPRSWRVPSPEVFSIEEETEEELSTGVATPDRQGRSRSRYHSPSHHHQYHHHFPDRNVQVEAAKPLKKKVRFILPGEEIA